MNVLSNKNKNRFYERMSQDVMANLYDTTKQNISYHLNNIFKENELNKNSVVKDFLTTASDCKNYNVLHYNLDVIIAEINALDRHPMTMQDWINELDSFLKMTRKDILKDSGKISHEQALKKAHEEYDKYMQIHLTTAEQDYLNILNKEIEELNK